MLDARDIVSFAHKLRLLPLVQYRARQSRESLAALQLRLLRETLQRAERDVPLYAEKFRRAGVDAASLSTLQDLERFPITEKDEVRDVFPRGAVAHGTDLEECRIQQTSGSSGQCMEIAIDRRSDDLRTLFTQRMYGWHGFRFWRKMAYLFPYALPLQKNFGLYRNHHISTHLPPDAILKELRAYRPHLLAATPSDLFDLCDGVGDDLRALGLRTICVHSEPLSSDERAFLRERFGCPIVTNYYCNEVWAIGSECPHGVLHQFPDSVVLEIVDDEGHAVPPGELGNVLVTSLHNYVQPFVRYRLGDLAAWSATADACSCGSRLPRIDRIEGRDDDYLAIGPDQRLHPSKLTVAVKSPCFAYPGSQIYRDYRITQDGPAHVTVQIVPGRDGELFEACARQAEQNVQRLLGPGFGVDLCVVDKLDRGSGGKRKIVERRWEPRGTTGDRV